MFKVVVLACLCVAALASPVFNRNLDGEWASYKQTYNKVYLEEEEQMRRLIWEDNVQYIELHNLAADRGQHSFWLGTNEYADMTNFEFRSVMNGYIMQNKTKGDTFMKPSNMGPVPDSVDWRKEGYVTEVKNQGHCGSCWAFSTTGSLEGQNFKSSGKLVSLSEQNLVDCSAREGNHGCKGGLMDNGFRYIEQNDGIDTEASYPYTAKNVQDIDTNPVKWTNTDLWKPGGGIRCRGGVSILYRPVTTATGLECKFKRADVGATDKGFVDIPHMNEEALQEAVATVGPISVAIDAGHKSFQLYKSGVYNEPMCSSTKLDHGVLAVGYGTNEETPYWLVKNSWGPSWGMEGYVMMSRNKRNQCGIATQASYPKV